MKKRLLYILAISTVIAFSACGESAEDISFSMDHEVPAYKVLTDSLVVSPLQEVQLKVEVSDNIALKRLVFSYGAWTLNEVINLDELPQKYTFERTITIPENAEKEWKENVTENDGTVVERNQTYHKVTLIATDVNMNVRVIPIYLKVK